MPNSKIRAKARDGGSSLTGFGSGEEEMLNSRIQAKVG